MTNPEQDSQYLLTDGDFKPLANGILVDSSDSAGWSLRVLNGQAEAAAHMRELQLISLSPDQISYLVRFVSAKGDKVTVRPVKPLGTDARENLRIPVDFSSFIFPLNGSWQGRRRIQALDLSCGGIAFSGEQPLSIGQLLEVVIPLAPHPLVVTGKVLRISPDSAGGVYAVKFLDLCDGADQLIREFVFSEQLRQHYLSKLCET